MSIESRVVHTGMGMGMGMGMGTVAAAGPEGPWRAANEASIHNSFTEDAGFDLQEATSTNLDQGPQIGAFTAFVDDGVDVILPSAAFASIAQQELEACVYQNTCTGQAPSRPINDTIIRTHDTTRRPRGGSQYL